MNLMTRVIISVKYLETVFRMKRYINPDYYYHYKMNYNVSQGKRLGEKLFEVTYH